MKTFEFFLPYYVWSWSFLTSIKRMFFTMFDYNIDLTKFRLWSYLGWIIFRLIFLYKMFCIWCNQINNAGITFYWIDYYRTFLSKIFTSLSGVINILLLGLFNRFNNWKLLCNVFPENAISLILYWIYWNSSYAFHLVKPTHTVKFLVFKSILINCNNILQWLFLLYHVLLCIIFVYYVKIH